MDLIVSPNRPYKLLPGNFDTFPTTSCMEASLCGVVLMCTDVLLINQHYKDGVDFILIEPEVDDIVKKVIILYNKPKKLVKLGVKGQRKSRKLYNTKAQMKRRIKIINAMIEKS
jgi:glycosyltransferase involved in cell wall biosynthesis